MELPLRHYFEYHPLARQPLSPAPSGQATAKLIIVKLPSAPIDERAADHMRELVEKLDELQEGIRRGGGPAKIAKQHKDGKLTARERIAKLIVAGASFLDVRLPAA